jgi:hypothetical protein
LVQINASYQGNGMVYGDANVVLNGDAIAYGGVGNDTSQRTYTVRTTASLPTKPVQP